MGVGRHGGRDCYIKSSRRALQDKREESGADFLGQSPVSPRPEVGDAADQGVPPGGDLRSRGPLVIRRREGRALALAWELARPARIGPRREQAKGKGEGKIWVFGPKIERESSFFILLFQSLFKNQFENHFETSLNYFKF